MVNKDADFQDHQDYFWYEKNLVGAGFKKDDFVELLKEPVLKTVSYNQAEEMVSNGAIWLDVRLPSEYQNRNITGSVNIPLYLLRLNAKKLSGDHQYIVYCDTGSHEGIEVQSQQLLALNSLNFRGCPR